jgi:hypothetical protein
MLDLPFLGPNFYIEHFAELYRYAMEDGAESIRSPIDDYPLGSGLDSRQSSQQSRSRDDIPEEGAKDLQIT